MPTKRTYLAAAIVVAAVIVGAAVVAYPSILQGPSQKTSASSTSLQGSGQLSIYLTDAPPSSQTLKYLLVNVSSVELRYAGNVTGSTTTTSTSSTSSSTNSSTSSTTSATSATTTTTSSSSTGPQNAFTFAVPSNVGLDVNLTSLHGQSLLLGATSMPAGNISSIVIHITGAKAFYTDGSSAQLKVVANGKLMVPVQFAVQANGSTDLTIDITPNLLHISQDDVLTPVIHVTSVERGPNNGSATTRTTEVDEAQSGASS